MTTQANSWVGRELAGGRYQIDSLLGEGGMGFVYRTHDRNLECAVVVKVPRRALLDDPDFAPRFAREIRSLVNLAHPHIVKISDVGAHDGLPFAVMQYLPGGSLEERCPSGSDGKPQPLPTATLADWLPDIAAALDFVHTQGYVHRDVKPANILFDAEGHAYLSDFGVAKALVTDVGVTSSRAMTGMGVVLGTPGYMAPELIMGQPFDGRVDQYALATTVYERLSGRRPFEGPTSMALLVQQTTQEPAGLRTTCPAVSEALAASVQRALSKKPEQRFPTCAAFARSVMAAAKSRPAARGAPPNRAPATSRATPSPTTPGRSGQTRIEVAPPAPASPSQEKGSASAADSTPWYCIVNGQVEGPFSRADLSALVRRGRLGLTSLVRQGGSEASWVAAGSVAGLFEIVAVEPPRVSRRRQRPIVLGVLGLVVLAVAGVAAVYWARRQGNHPVEARTEPDRPPVGVPAQRVIAPLVLAPIPDQNVNEEEALRLTVLVEGPSITGRRLRYSLAPGYPPGATINEDTGVFEWTPTEAQGPGQYQVSVCVSEGEQETPIDKREFKIAVSEVCQPPTIASIDEQLTMANQLVELTVNASDPDVPAGKLTFGLEPNAPEGARIDPDTGHFTWTPTASQVGETYPVTVTVTKPGPDGPSATQDFTIRVKPLDHLTNSIGMKLVLIPAGTFTMGSNESDAEKPPHSVRITRPFYLGAREVTQGQYQVVMGENPSYFKGADDLPVETVSWLDAVRFCNKLSARENRKPCYLIEGATVTLVGGAGYRLPTEAEWEYACRAGSPTKYGFGDDPAQLNQYAWSFENAGEKSHPVGLKQPNQWGLYDMLGNVYEWCWDGYKKDYYKESPPDDPQGPAQASYRVFRGGSWSYYPWNCRPAFRDWDAPDSWGSILGFRLAAVLSGP